MSDPVSIQDPGLQPWMHIRIYSKIRRIRPDPDPQHSYSLGEGGEREGGEGEGIFRKIMI
jgi:hypothetical protein